MLNDNLSSSNTRDLPSAATHVKPSSVSWYPAWHLHSKLSPISSHICEHQAAAVSQPTPTATDTASVSKSGIRCKTSQHPSRHAVPLSLTLTVSTIIVSNSHLDHLLLVQLLLLHKSSTWAPWVWGTTKSALYKYTYLYLYLYLYTVSQKNETQ